ncbi:MAG: malto-oligosyltrehalose trehalohydrolase [Nitrospirae bacterium]|nr:malto-oligosyltrehalose trehalohydrolase [Nitrospirota bacterium]MBF0535155.1 malto-oligosyltrehalose trehalohydrolase [Nitrospirota bacterium]MBF0615226.1 malto-oligosyltrehalose trehalohydrolase [Nitrospirota bacterium]
MKEPIFNNGAHYSKDSNCHFSLWAPDFQSVELKICMPLESYFLMKKDNSGFWSVTLDDISPDTTYKFRLNSDREIPDPASHYQPRGVHEPSQVVCHEDFIWEDSSFSGIDLSEMIMYELHVGTFTTAGTFEAVTEQLDDLLSLGINAIELMPVAQFPGSRNWGYDGVYPYGVQNSYGGPAGLKKLVNECHKKGIAVILDVVYNHLGPEGNYLWGLGSYFTNTYRTPWGNAINFDGPMSDNVKLFFIENAIYWFDRYHIDALRLDAVHAIFDYGAKTFLEQLAEAVDAYSRQHRKKHYLIAESDLNDSNIIKPAALGGFGIDAQWSDDYHHCLHTLLTAETSGYYLDFGTVGHLARTLREGYAYTGEYSNYRKRSHGNSARGCHREQFVVFSQNHDQVGNRLMGERLSALVSFEALKLAAATVILSPYVPMLFMGEEYGEDAPFQFFVNFSGNALIENIRKGRKREYREFHKKGTPPDPQDLGTFLRSKLIWEKRQEGNHKILLEFYKALIKIRKEIPVFSCINSVNVYVDGREKQKVVIIRRHLSNDDANSVLCIFNFNKDNVQMSLNGLEAWERFFCSAAAEWAGAGSESSEILICDEPFTIAGLSVSLYNKKSVALL